MHTEERSQLRDPERRSPNRDPHSHLSPHCSLTPSASVSGDGALVSTACFVGSFKQQKNQQVWKALRKACPTSWRPEMSITHAVSRWPASFCGNPPALQATVCTRTRLGKSTEARLGCQRRKENAACPRRCESNLLASHRKDPLP